MSRQAVMADMHQSKSLLMTLAGAFRHRPWPPSTAVPPKIDKTGPLEEETTPYYDPRYFYPARLGEVVNQRYQLATKLGFGTSSTVWLARDLFQLRPCQAHFIDCANEQ
jgi:serine/threonine-protein kinase SRPK3